LYCFAQAQKTINGIVVCNAMALEKIDVVNLNSKKSSTTDSQGNFSIEAKVGDELFVLSNDYYDIKISLTKENFKLEKVIINLTKKPIELDEVTINKVEKISLKVSPEEIRMAKIAKFENSPIVLGVYTGEMPYGVDFIQIGKMAGKLFKSNNPKPKAKEEKITFKEYAKANFEESFFSKTLELKKEEIPEFLNYCEANPQSKTIIEKDELAILEFLLTNKTEFKKLK
jgi:hypothetical protein